MGPACHCPIRKSCLLQQTKQKQSHGVERTLELAMTLNVATAIHGGLRRHARDGGRTDGRRGHARHLRRGHHGSTREPRRPARARAGAPPQPPQERAGALVAGPDAHGSSAAAASGARRSPGGWRRRVRELRRSRLGSTREPRRPARPRAGAPPRPPQEHAGARRPARARLRSTREAGGQHERTREPPPLLPWARARGPTVVPTRRGSRGERGAGGRERYARDSKCGDFRVRHRWIGSLEK